MHELIYKEINFAQAAGYSFLIGKILIFSSLAIFLIRRKFAFNFKTHASLQLVFLVTTIIAMPVIRHLLGFVMGSQVDPFMEGLRFFSGLLGSGAMALGAGMLVDSLPIGTSTQRGIRKTIFLIALFIHIFALLFWIKNSYDKYGFGNKHQVEPKFNFYESEGYKQWNAYTDYMYSEADMYRKEFEFRVDHGHYDIAVNYLNDLFQNKITRDSALGRGIASMTSDGLVKAFYRQGKLRDAIIARKRSLPLMGKSQFSENSIVELWQLQDMYKKQVGEDKYNEDKDVSAQIIEPDPVYEKVLMGYLDAEFRKPDTREMWVADYMSNFYFSHLQFDKAENECKKAIKIFYELRKQFKTKDFDYERGNFEFRLLSLLALQGRYQEALDMIKEMKKTYTDTEYGPRILAQMEKTLKEALEKGLSPSDIAYPQLRLGTAAVDSAFYIRDKSFNRLDSDEPNTTGWVIVKYLN